jgi:uncharacterized protein (DUF1778 family)
VSGGTGGEARDKRGDLSVADRTSFELDEHDWRGFMELIDRPAVVPKGLRSLFSKPSVFE